MLFRSAAGSVANVPFVTGVSNFKLHVRTALSVPQDCDDEGTLFSLSTLNITYVTPAYTKLSWLTRSIGRRAASGTTC